VNELQDPLPRLGLGSPAWAERLCAWLERLVRDRLGRIDSIVIQAAGDPTAIDAPVGTMYLRTDGGAGTTLYVREPSGWVGK
jgi:hypothetical protein